MTTRTKRLCLLFAAWALASYVGDSRALATQPELGAATGRVSSIQDLNDNATWAAIDCFRLSGDCLMAGQTLLLSGQISDYRCSVEGTQCGDYLNTLLEVLPFD
jgi:hypothetical protein